MIIEIDVVQDGEVDQTTDPLVVDTIDKDLCSLQPLRQRA